MLRVAWCCSPWAWAAPSQRLWECSWSSFPGDNVTWSSGSNSGRGSTRIWQGRGVTIASSPLVFTRRRRIPQFTCDDGILLGQQDAMARLAAGRPYRCRKDSSAQHETCCTRIVRPHNAFRSLVRIRDSPRGCLKRYPFTLSLSKG